MNFGVCWGCGKSISFEKVSICNNCDLKYIAQIKEYIRNNNGVVTREKLIRESNIMPQARMNKYIDYLEKEGVLVFSKEGANIDEKQDDDSEVKKINSRRELLQNFQSQLQQEKLKMNEDKTNGIGTAMYTGNFNNRRK